MSTLVRLSVLILLSILSLSVYALAIRSQSTNPTISYNPQPQQRPLTQPKDCSSHITQSLSHDYSWSSADALSLAQCLLTHDPNPSTCVFYTRSARDLAIQYALETNRTTIYDVYPPAYFNISISPAREWNTSGHLRDLFRITSKAYAIACSGTATLVLPEDEEPCPSSIWVTDEYDAIRNKLSKIELPIYRVSWSLDKAKGVWGWLRKLLGQAAGRIGVGEGSVGKRDLDDEVTQVWENVRSEYLEPLAEEVRERLEAVKEQWGGGAEDSDPWSLVDGMCANPQR